MTTLRLYQSTALDALFAYWRDQAGNPLIVAPTGSGKSILQAEMFRRLREGWPDMRMICATHVRELIRQDYEAMLRVWPTAPVGIYSAGLGHRSLGNPITFCGIQSVYKRATEFGHVDLLSIDEAHLLSRRMDSMYGRFIMALRAINPDMKVVGFTATPYRLDSGRLDQGDDRIFDGIAYDIPIQELVDLGYLAPLVSKATELKLDTSGVRKRGGEFIESELQKAIDTDKTTIKAVAEIVSYGKRRRSWLCFCTGVHHAQRTAEYLQRRGVNARWISGEMTTEERDYILNGFKKGTIQAVTNANILTTGFDHPELDMIAMLRPTLSTGLYVQMLGRGMRPADGKENCLILDFARNIERHGPVDAVNVKQPGDGTGVAPTKECPVCHEIVYAGVMICPDCGYEWPPREVESKLTASASAAPVMARDIGASWARVDSWGFLRHAGKDGKPDTLRVIYRCGLQSISEWLCFDHSADSYAYRKAADFWISHGGGYTVPHSVTEALELQDRIRPPAEILVRPEGRFFEVLSRRTRHEEAA